MNAAPNLITKTQFSSPLFLTLIFSLVASSLSVSSEELEAPDKLAKSDIQFEQVEGKATDNKANEQLTAKEIQIVNAIDSNYKQAISLLETVVNINSGTMNFNGVKKVGSIFRKELDKLGFKTKWIDGKEFSRAGHLIAEYGIQKVKVSKNKEKKVESVNAAESKITSEESVANQDDEVKQENNVQENDVKEKVKFLLIGHLDTVFTKKSQFQKFKIEDDGLVAGPGITDMKGGDIVMLEAIRALKAADVLDLMQIIVVMTGDEEKRGSPYEVATKELVEAGKWADIALGFEDGDGDPKTAVISRRGATGWQLNVTGRAAHSSQIFREGYGFGAIFEAARILDQFRMKLAAKPNLTFNPGLILGGTDVNSEVATSKGDAAGKANVIAQTTIVKGDIRALFPHQLVASEKAMRAIVANNLSETSAKLTFFTGYPPMAPSVGNKSLLELYSQVSQDLGFGEVEAVDPKKAGAADISFVANDVEMAIDGLGLMGTGGHTEREKADISTLSSQSKRAALLMLRLSQR
ncbi:MAG: glutamate carboxypeptidase [Polaribacter sp.]|jgi:glutamate carboxypeptidase